jgi:RNA polymerase sigma-70 factor (ECF subfamily)
MAVDEQAVVSVLLRERSKLIAYAWSMVRSFHVAEDVFQEVSMLALEKRGEIHGPEQVLPWLRTVVRHRALKARAKSVRGPVAMDEQLLDLLEDAWQAQDAERSTDLMDALERCLAKLTPRAREIIRYRYGLGMSGIDVARALDRQVHAVYKALARIHVTLAECIQRRIRVARGGT